MALPIKFYHDLMSQPARALYMFLNLNKIPYESCPISIQKGEHLSKDFRTVNRFRKIPCIDDNGFRLAETPSIMQYLARKHQDTVPDHWYPSEPKDRARVDEFLSWNQSTFRNHLMTYFWLSFAMPNMVGTSVGPERIAEAKDNMQKTLDFVEKVYLVDGRFIAGGERISIADLLALSEIKQLDMTDYNPIVGRPKIQRYMEQVIAATQPEYDEGYKVLHKLVALVNAKKSKAQ